MIPVSTAKLIGLAIAAAAILSFVILAFHWKSTMAGRGKELATICAATRAAAENPKLDCKQVPAQIGQLGQSIAALKSAIADQNEAIASLGKHSADQQAAAAQASQVAQNRAGKAQATSGRLTASSRASDAQAKPCAPSKALTDAWQ